MGRVWGFVLAAAILCVPAFGFGETVERVVDGDTLVLAGGVTVRLIGVDTPETNHPSRPPQYFGKEASEFLRKIAEGREVSLKYDHQRTDRYGRTLAYVYLPGGAMANEELIRQGYGYAYTRFPFKYSTRFTEIESEARGKGLGLWRGGGLDEARWYVKNGPGRFEVYGMNNGRWFVVCAGMVKPSLDDEGLVRCLRRLGYLVHGRSPHDLRRALEEDGWAALEASPGVSK